MSIQWDPFSGEIQQLKPIGRNNTTYIPLIYCQLGDYLVGGFNPFEKYATVKLDHFPRYRDEHKKYLKPPTRRLSGCPF